MRSDVIAAAWGLGLLASCLSAGACAGQLDPRTADYYLDRARALEADALMRRGVLADAATIAPAYLNPETGGLNDAGFRAYVDVKKDVYQEYFLDHLYLQHITEGGYVYVLYFSRSGFDDLHWDVVRWEAPRWQHGERLSPARLDRDDALLRLFGNYDEGPKNMEGARLYREGRYLVLDRGGLHHSLYDLEGGGVVVNEESPWHASGGAGEAELDAWIETHLHDPIDAILRQRD